jgi:hypothetical protein
MKTTITLSLDIRSRQKLEDISKASGKYMSTIVEEFILAAQVPVAVDPGQKQILAVQGLDGELRVNGDIHL